MSADARTTGRQDAATRVIVALASASQAAGLYPPGHPNRQEVTTEVVIWVRRLLDGLDDGEDPPPLFIVRHAFYLGPNLLAAASMDHERLIEAFEEAGIGAVGFRPEVAPQDIDALLRMLHGDLPTTAPVPGLAVNQVEPAVTGVGTGDRGIGRSVDFARHTVADAYAGAADGRAPDAETVMRVARRLVGDVLADPDRAVLMALSGGERSRSARSVDTAVLAVAAGRRLGRSTDQLATLACGALLADVGLALLPEGLTHHHEPLTSDERRLVHRHPVDGATLLLSDPEEILAPAATIALQHHARVDGHGYPPLGVGVRPILDAQLVGIADTYTALIRPRPYRRPARPRHALATILAESGHAWDASVVGALVEVLGAHPIGSYVRLATGEVGLVTKANRRLPDRPVVRIVQDAEGGEGDGSERDTSTWDGFDFVWNVDRSVDVSELTASAVPAPAEPGPPSARR